MLVSEIVGEKIVIFFCAVLHFKVDWKTIFKDVLTFHMDMLCLSGEVRSWQTNLTKIFPGSWDCMLMAKTFNGIIRLNFSFSNSLAFKSIKTLSVTNILIHSTKHVKNISIKICFFEQMSEKSQNWTCLKALSLQYLKGRLYFTFVIFNRSKYLAIDFAFDFTSELLCQYFYTA